LLNVPRPNEELLRILRQTSLKGFPNPERKGCPDAEVLKTLALHPERISASDPIIEHVTQCSPCFEEMTRHRKMARAEKNASH
jgi:hypothetical protein